MCRNVESSVCSWQYGTLPGYYWDVQLLNNWNASHSCGCSLGGRSQNTVGRANKTDARAASSSPLLRPAELRALLFRSRLFRDRRCGGGWRGFHYESGGVGVSDAAAALRGEPDTLHNLQRCPAAPFSVYFSSYKSTLVPERAFFLHVEAQTGCIFFWSGTSKSNKWTNSLLMYWLHNLRWYFIEVYRAVYKRVENQVFYQRQHYRTQQILAQK